MSTASFFVTMIKTKPMPKNSKSLLVIIAFFALAGLPALASLDGKKIAQCSGGSCSVGGSAVPISSGMSFSELHNALGTTDPSVVIGRIINFVMLLIGTLALIMIIYGGFLWMTSQGNDAKVKTARAILLWTSAGILIIYMAYVLVHFIFELIGK